MRSRVPLLLGMIFVFLFSQTNNSFSALDDGYPEGVAAPGRTCPQTPLGEKIVSPHTGKTLVCITIDNRNTWWLENEPLPKPSQKESAPKIENSLPVITHTYTLPRKSLSKMKIFSEVVYGNESSAQKLDIYLPKSAKTPPLLIWLHGGGFMFLDKSVVKFDEAAKALEKLISNGIGVASIDYRLASEAKFPAAAQDVKRAVNFLRLNAAKYGYDSTKFGVLGESNGAFLANMIGATANQVSVFDFKDETTSKVSANVSFVVSISGNVDFRSMRANTEAFPCTENKGKTFPNMDNPWFGSEKLPGVTENINSANLIPYLKSNRELPKFFIIHGTEDCAVSQRESIELNNLIKDIGGRSELILVKNGTHGGKTVWNAAIKLVPKLKEAFFSNAGKN